MGIKSAFQFVTYYTIDEQIRRNIAPLIQYTGNPLLTAFLPAFIQSMVYHEK